MQQATIFGPENSVTLSRKLSRVPSSAHPPMTKQVVHGIRKPYTTPPCWRVLGHGSPNLPAPPSPPPPPSYGGYVYTEAPLAGLPSPRPRGGPSLAAAVVAAVATYFRLGVLSLTLSCALPPSLTHYTTTSTPVTARDKEAETAV